MANIEIITLSQAVETIKTAILQSQARAARNVSANQLALYFSVGGYISLNTRQQQWGSGAIETISERLQKELPGLQGFSERNIRNMRQFYEAWSNLLIWQPAAAKLEKSSFVQRKTHITNISSTKSSKTRHFTLKLFTDGINCSCSPNFFARVNRNIKPNAKI